MPLLGRSASYCTAGRGHWRKGVGNIIRLRLRLRLRVQQRVCDASAARTKTRSGRPDVARRRPRAILSGDEKKTEKGSGGDLVRSGGASSSLLFSAGKRAHGGRRPWSQDSRLAAPKQTRIVRDIGARGGYSGYRLHWLHGGEGGSMAESDGHCSTGEEVRDTAGIKRVLRRSWGSQPSWQRCAL